MMGFNGGLIWNIMVNYTSGFELNLDNQKRWGGSDMKWK